jgi:hypothetical protein
MLRTPWPYRIFPRIGKTKTLKSSAAVPRALATMLVVYLVVNAALYVLVERGVLPLKDPLYSNQLKYFRRQAAFFGPCDKPRVLAIGSSRTQLAFDPFTFMKHYPCEAYNFGSPAAGSMTCALYLRRLYNEGLQADLVFIEWHPGFTAKPTDGRSLEDHWLFDNRLHPDEYDHLTRWGNPRQMPPANTPWNFWRAVSRYRVEFVHRYLPTFEVVQNVSTTADVEFPRGYYAGLPHVPENYDAGIRATQRTYGSVFGNYHYGGPGVEALRDMVQLVKSHGGTPVVVVTAEASEVQALYGPRANAELEEAFAKDWGCRVVNARDWLQREHTVDGHHATAEGSRVFTRRLAEIVTPVKTR